MNFLGKEKHSISSLPLLFVILVGLWVILSTCLLSEWSGSIEEYKKLELIKDIGTVILLAWLLNKVIKWKTAQLAESEARFRLLIENSPVPIVVHSEEKVVYLNIAAAKLFLVENRDSVIGSSIWDYVHPDDRGFIEEHMRKRQDSSENYVIQEKLIRCDGKAIHAEVASIQTTYANKQATLVVIRDITEQKAVEEKLFKSQKQYESVVKHVKEVIYQTDADGRWTLLNPAWTDITGYSIEESIGHNCLEFVYPEDREMYVPCYKILLMGETDCCKQEIRYQIKGGGYRWVEVFATLTHSDDGEIIGTSGTITDITERKETEELLRKSDKLSVIGQLAAGVAHEIRNPLTSLKGFVQLLNTTNNEHKYYYDITLSEMDRINFIVSEFLILSKPQALRLEEKNLELLLHNVVALLSMQAILNNIEIVSDIEEGLPSITCAENPIKQVFIDILKNAMEAMPNGGRIAIQAKRNGDTIKISFIDQGCGIPHERIPKLGEPFYSTKEHGTGLGLMVSYRIIEDHHGTIRICSERDKGTTVEITLPVSLTIP